MSAHEDDLPAEAAQEQGEHGVSFPEPEAGGGGLKPPDPPKTIAADDGPEGAGLESPEGWAPPTDSLEPMRWAEAFCDLLRHNTPEKALAAAQDEGMMTGWFSNVLEPFVRRAQDRGEREGYLKGRAEGAREARSIVETAAGRIVRRLDQADSLGLTPQEWDVVVDDPDLKQRYEYRGVVAGSADAAAAKATAQAYRDNGYNPGVQMSGKRVEEGKPGGDERTVGIAFTEDLLHYTLVYRAGEHPDLDYTAEQAEADEQEARHEAMRDTVMEAQSTKIADLREQLRTTVLHANALDEAIRLTQEFVGDETLPAIEGWSWFDARESHRAFIRMVSGWET